MVLQGNRQGQTWLEFRGFPLIDVDKFLSFIDLEQVEEGDAQVNPLNLKKNILITPEKVAFDVPTDVAIFEGLSAAVSLVAEEVTGEPPVCSDCALHAAGVSSKKSYKIQFSTAKTENLLTVFFNPGKNASASRAKMARRVDYHELAGC